MVQWFQEHRRATVYLIAGVVVAALIVAWSVWSGRQAETRAGEQLSQARFALESENLPLAASEFARIGENYAGTRAADEATLLLAHVRLLQEQNEQAVTVLRDFAPRADSRYRAQAFGLLAVAYENLGRWREAAEAADRAAEAALWPALKAQFLLEAGLRWAAAGDTAGAVANLNRVISDFEDTGPVTEAKVRLGEITRGAVP
jgi:predicted negative regulator of RcsB-dependent stress response